MNHTSNTDSNTYMNPGLNTNRVLEAAQPAVSSGHAHHNAKDN